MASDASPVTITRVSPVIATQAASGKVLPQGGKTAASAAAAVTVQSSNAAPPSNKAAGVSSASAAKSSATEAVTHDAKSAPVSRSDPQTLVDQVNKVLNDSGRADQFRVDPTSKYIEQVNPSTGAVVAQFSVNEFPALARGVGASGLIIDAVA